MFNKNVLFYRNSSMENFPKFELYNSAIDFEQVGVKCHKIKHESDFQNLTSLSNLQKYWNLDTWNASDWKGFKHVSACFDLQSLCKTTQHLVTLCNKLVKLEAKSATEAIGFRLHRTETKGVVCF